MPFVTTDDGIELNYRVDDLRTPWSDKTADHILMHHGWSKSMQWWTPCVPALARQFPIVRYDVRGCGGSTVPPPERAWSVDRFVADALNVLDRLELDRVHWIGFESGGAYGLAFAATHPDRVISVSTVNTGNSTYTHTGGLNTYFGLGYPSVVAAIQSLGLEEWLARTVGIHVDVSVADKALIRWVQTELFKTPLPVMKAWLDAYVDMDTEAYATSVKVPALLMAGANHGYGCEPAQARKLAAHISNCRVEHLPNVGAGIQLVAPDACTSVLLNFLAGVPGRAGEDRRKGSRA